MGGFWVGADPGGRGHFGLALLDGVSDRQTLMTVSSVDEAVKKIAEAGKPQGMGIDAPLWWSTRKGGGRKVDRCLRRNYEIASGTVQSANSLRGSVLAGGVMLVSRVRERFPDTPVTESHPKALLKAGFKGLLTSIDHAANNEHERDALLAAICARQGFDKRWNRDLAEDRWCEEQNPLSRCSWLGPVHYYWPEDLACQSVEGGESRPVNSDQQTRYESHR